MKIEMKLEKFYGMPFMKIISEIHWKQKKSISSISKECGILRQSIMHLCKVNGVQLRKHLDAVRINPNKGENHWAYGLTKDTSKKYRDSSQRMKLNNPTHDKQTAIRMAKSKAITYRNTKLSQEMMFKDFLERKKIEFIFQYPIEKYIIDFFIPNKNICIEIDSTDKWGTDRKIAANRKDKHLTDLGYLIIRINKRLLFTDGHKVLDILKANKIIT